MKCKLCKESEELEERNCVFRNKGKFNVNNWNCETINHLRNLVEEDYIIYNPATQCSFVCLPFDYGFFCMTWYKSRGRISKMFIENDGELDINPDENKLLYILDILKNK